MENNVTLDVSELFYYHNRTRVFINDTEIYPKHFDVTEDGEMIILLPVNKIKILHINGTTEEYIGEENVKEYFKDLLSQEIPICLHKSF